MRALLIGALVPALLWTGPGLYDGRLSVAHPARAQLACDRHDDVVGHLARQYGERRIGLGLSNSGGMIELFVNPETGSWTLTVTAPSGRTCLLSTGTNWEGIPAMPDDERT